MISDVKKGAHIAKGKRLIGQNDIKLKQVHNFWTDKVSFYFFEFDPFIVFRKMKLF